MDISKAVIEGPCTITFNGVNMGHTLEGVEVTIERDFTDVNVDRYGKTPIDKILLATRAMVKFKLAQPNWPQLNLSMPETSSFDGAGTNDRIDIGGDAGFSLRNGLGGTDAAGLLVIHPMSRLGDLSADVTFYRAASFDNIELHYKVDEQRVVEVNMVAFVDESYGIGRRLGHIGQANVS